MVTVAVPAPAEALIGPDETVATPTEDVAVVPSPAFFSDALSLEQPIKPAIRTAAPPTPTTKPRITDIPFVAVAHVRGHPFAN